MTALELFPCSGGMAEGFRRAGITFDWAFDIAKEHCDSYEKNLGHRPVQMDVRDLLRMALGGWRPTEQLDLVVADPPCTPWSRAGKRKGVEDPRDMLGETCELIQLLRPRAYLIGNVPGLDDSTQWHHLQQALAPLRKTGYCIADYVTLDAADFGVPQHRVRPFWFGHLAGPCISWPLPTHGDAGGNGELVGMELLPWVTCRAALEHLPLEQLGRPVRLRRRENARLGRIDEAAGTVTAGGRGAQSILVNDRHSPASPASPAPTLGAKIRGQAGQVLDLRTGSADGRDTRHGHPVSEPNRPALTVTPGSAAGGNVLLAPMSNHPISRPDEPAFVVKTNGGRASQAGSMLAFPTEHRTDPMRPARTLTTNRSDDARFLDWPWNRPSTTVCGRDTIPPPGHHPESGSILSLPNAVVLSELAATILQGFPENWSFLGETKTARWSQLGQAMPPPLAHAVARSVGEQLKRTESTGRVA